MNSDTYQHKKESITGDSHSAGQEMETGKDISKVFHKHTTLLIMAGSLLTVLVWIAMTGHSGGAGGEQYVTATADDMNQEAGGALAAEYEGETVKSEVLAKDIFSLGKEVGPFGYDCGPNCFSLVAKVAADPRGIPWCAQSSFISINDIDYCFAPCNLYWCDHTSLSGMGLTSVQGMYGKVYEGKFNCETDYCQTGYGSNYDDPSSDDYEGSTDVCPSGGSYDYASYLCQKCPKITVPAPGYGGATWCVEGGPYYVGKDGKEYCWSTCSAQANRRDCSEKKGFWRLGSCQLHKCPGSQYSTLCQRSNNWNN